MDTHINYFHIQMPNVNYVKDGWTILYFIFPGNLPCIQPSLFSSGSIDCCLDMAHNSNAVTSLPHVYHFLLFLCYFANAYLPLVEKEKQKEIKK